MWIVTTLPGLWIPALHAGMTVTRRFVCNGMPMTLVAHFHANGHGAMTGSPPLALSRKRARGILRRLRRIRTLTGSIKHETTLACLLRWIECRRSARVHLRQPQWAAMLHVLVEALRRDPGFDAARGMDERPIVAAHLLQRPSHDRH
jgi:hypothetical protein